MTDAVVSFVLENLKNLLIHEVNLFRGVKNEVNLLRSDLGFMNAFLKDSEGKEANHHLVKELIDQIREAAFDAEDVINRYMAQVVRQRVRNLPKKLFHCLDHAAELHRVAEKTTSLRKRIENIYANKTTYGIEARSHGDENAEQLLEELGSLFFFTSYFDHNALERAVKNFRFIRSLSFEVSNIHHSLHRIPEEIGQLVFLRYFKISVTYAYVWLKAIPASICKLPYLETIHVQAWIEEGLPKEIWIMKQLRHLYVGHGIGLPQPPSKGGHTLSNLQVLCRVEVDKKTAILFRKSLFPNLRKLHLSRSHTCLIDQSMVSEILASLESSQYLQILKLERLTIGSLSSLSSSKLTKITVLNCNSVDLISLGKLANLQILKIKRCDISSRQLHFMAGEFPQLEVFKMIGLRDIESWELETDAMPNLQHLVIKRCTSLRNLPDELWSLANLRMVQVSDIEADLKEKLMIKQSELKEDGYSCKLIIN
ncbi:hypothetical protein FEM48_Zijuj07G0053100 [Ziziphus jujuba var. spinosa]|uniref:Rx N-terminal domain-containing protein n=1 Tax=Ziziphus jujuba var. spinosa TaxID=714518 RepID=A0A978V2P4_ZIZJJ|nr:hypothetical protein FEM48_Zijuj07G0053100 [Ziziphus jujuba var. spinosa]